MIAGVSRTDLVGAFRSKTGRLEKIKASIRLGDVGANGEAGLEEEAGLFRVRDLYAVDFDADVAGRGKDFHTLLQANYVSSWYNIIRRHANLVWIFRVHKYLFALLEPCVHLPKRELNEAFKSAAIVDCSGSGCTLAVDDKIVCISRR